MGGCAPQGTPVPGSLANPWHAYTTLENSMAVHTSQVLLGRRVGGKHSFTEITLQEMGCVHAGHTCHASGLLNCRQHRKDWKDRLHVPDNRWL